MLACSHRHDSHGIPQCHTCMALVGGDRVQHAEIDLLNGSLAAPHVTRQAPPVLISCDDRLAASATGRAPFPRHHLPSRSPRESARGARETRGAGRQRDGEGACERAAPDPCTWGTANPACPCPQSASGSARACASGRTSPLSRRGSKYECWYSNLARICTPL